MYQPYHKKTSPNLFDLIFYIPVNNFSVMSGRVFMVLSKDKCFFLKDTTQWPWWGSNLRPSVSSQALYHWATVLPKTSPNTHSPVLAD